MRVADASSSNEAVHLQQRLRSLSTELVTLRNRLHVQGAPATAPTTKGSVGGAGNNAACVQPAVPPRTPVLPVPPAVAAAPLAPACPVQSVTCATATAVPCIRTGTAHPTSNSNGNTTVIAEPRPLQPGTVAAELEDLIHMQGPLTEDAVMKCLQARFASSNFYVSTYLFLDVSTTVRFYRRTLLLSLKAIGSYFYIFSSSYALFI